MKKSFYPLLVLGIIFLSMILLSLILLVGLQLNPPPPTPLPLPTPTTLPLPMPTITLPPPTPTITLPQDELAEIIDEEIKKLAPGQILFNPPLNMKVGKKERVEVRIDKTFDENLSEGLRGRGELQIENIKVGTVMKVQLIGNNFDIEPLSEEEQLVSGIGITQWEYDVMPKKAGDQIIILKVSTIIILPEGKEKTICIPVFERKIYVEVNPIYSIKNFIEINWKWIVSLIVTSGLISWILKKWKLKK